MSQYIPTASALAQHKGGIGALGELTFVAEVIIMERGDSREFLTLKGESLGIVKKPEWPIGVTLRASAQLESIVTADTYESDKATLSKDIQSHHFDHDTLVFLSERNADELAQTILLRQHMRATERKSPA
jgi:hypothetical protein